MYIYAKNNVVNDLTRRRRYEVLQAVILRRQSIVGLLSGTMSRDAAFQFLRLGSNVERADMTTRILDVSVAIMLPRAAVGASQYSDLAWMNILKALSAYQMYRRYVSVHADGARVIEFVLKNKEFPRTIIHCLRELIEVLHQLPHPEPILASVRDALAIVEQADATGLAQRGVHTFTDQIQLHLAHIDAALRQHYFKVGDVAASTEAAA